MSAYGSNQLIPECEIQSIGVIVESVIEKLFAILIQKQPLQRRLHRNYPGGGEVLITPAQDLRMAIRRRTRGKGTGGARGVALFFVDSPDDI